jgi:hypothetical protein
MPEAMDGFRSAVRFLLHLAGGASPAPDEKSPKRLCHAFLERLGSEPHSPARGRAARELEEWARDTKWREIAWLFAKGADIVETEVADAFRLEPGLRTRFSNLASALKASEGRPHDTRSNLIQHFWEVFLPDAVGIEEDWEHRIRELRRRRAVDIESLCSQPVARPARELLWTSNVLLTVPDPDTPSGDLHVEPSFRRRLESIDPGEQKYWYDHPVQIGVPPERNEILYGLRGISDMLRFEKKRGTAVPADRLAVALSVSVTHPGLDSLAREYVEGALAQANDIDNLDIYVFTEVETRRLVEEFLCPAARLFGLTEQQPEYFTGIFGVDGPYARHYNFLKAISALWQIVRDPALKATFKFDLDQVFPEERLVRELGRSAFELLCTPLWGATGKDQGGEAVELSMIAGALVNESDIDRGLFTPDVTLPSLPLPADRWIFPTQVPQALSTAAEMMARHGQDDLGGEHRVSSRFHVTGGTTGIRVDALRRFRPFAHSRMSRAEDQAYIMAVLYGPGPPYLRYAHVPGLIMRHDKHGLIDEAIRTAAAGKAVGDYERMVLFSHYARALPWSWNDTRAALGPFTGGFIHPIPVTTALLAFALKVLGLKDELEVEVFLQVGSRKLGALLRDVQNGPDWIRPSYQEEQAAWNAYYEILTRLEEALEGESAEAQRLCRRAADILEATKVHGS